MTSWQELERFKQENPLYTAAACANALRCDPAFVRATAARRGWTFPRAPIGRPHKVKLRSARDGDGLYALRGEKTYCAEGHHLGTMNQDVMVGQDALGTLDLAPGMAIGLLHCPFCYAATNENGCYYFGVEP